MRNHRSLRLQLLLRTLFTVGFVILLMVDAFVLQNNKETDKTKEITTPATMNNSDSKASFIHAKEVQQEHEDDESRHGDLNYVVSKRKTPRGPDPIHNRRARNSRRPPGRE